MTLTITLFFLFLSDAILSYWVPNFLDEVYKDAGKAGIVFAFSSVVGLIADIVLPQLIRGITVKKLIIGSIFFNILFSLTLLGNTTFTFLVVSLTAMAWWGIYYELMSFSQQQFISDATPVRLHASAWGFLGVFKALAYLMGPILASPLYEDNHLFPLYIGLVFSFFALAFLMLLGSVHKRKIEIEPAKVNLLAEIGHWKVLLSRVWTIVTISLFLGFIDSFYWTVGAVWMEEVAQTSFWGKFLLSAYTAPSLFMGFVVAKWGIYSGKKRQALRYFIASSLVLAFLPAFKSVFWQIFIVFISSTLLSVVYPLIEAVYSDIVQRMGRERDHLIGLNSSSVSLAYVIGPILAGYIAKVFGIEMSFVVLGLSSFVTGVFLLFVTPKKIKVPQKEIVTWKD